MREFLLWDHDGVLVDTERWYFAATQETLRRFDIELGQDTYLHLMADGRPSWDLARARGISEEVISMARRERDELYQRYLLQEEIEIAGVSDVLGQLHSRYRMAIVSTSRRADF